MRNFVDYYIKYTERINSINDSAINAPQELISQMEQQYRKRMKEIADFISQMGYGHKIMMIAGPSSSGKTTTSAMICGYLRELGIGALQVSLDNFFLSKSDAPRLADGTQDYESVNALDIKLMQKCLLELIANGETSMPSFDFLTGSRSERTVPVRIGENDVVIVEGIHALNPIITKCLPDNQMLKMYISIKQGIKHGNDIVLGARDLRLIRRLVRDFKFRNSTPQNTFDMWEQVCHGEDQFIAPFKRLANITVNTIHIYEPCVFRQSAVQLLQQIEESSVHYSHAQSLIENISRFEEIPAELVPEDSLLREFIGGGIY